MPVYPGALRVADRPDTIRKRCPAFVRTNSAIPLRIVAKPVQNKLLDRDHQDGYSATMKHLDLRRIVISSPISARLVKAVPVWVLLVSAIGPLTAQQLFVNAASGVDTNLGTQERPLRSLRKPPGGSTPTQRPSRQKSLWPPACMSFPKRRCSRTVRLIRQRTD